MRVVVFGATGGTGREVVEQATDHGYEVTAFVHSGHPLPAFPVAVRVAQGNVLNADDVERAVSGQDAVISALGVPGNSREPVASEGVLNITLAMRKLGVRRLIVESAHGAAESASEVPWPVRFIIRRVLLRNPFSDKDRMEQIVKGSNLDWIIVRPTELTNGPMTGHYRVGEHIPIGATPHISRADVANFLVQQLQGTEYIGKSPTLTY